MTLRLNDGILKPEVKQYGAVLPPPHKSVGFFCYFCLSSSFRLLFLFLLLLFCCGTRFHMQSDWWTWGTRPPPLSSSFLLIPFLKTSFPVFNVNLHLLDFDGKRTGVDEDVMYMPGFFLQGEV